MIPENLKYVIVYHKTISKSGLDQNYYLYFDEFGILRQIPTDICLQVEAAPGYYGDTLFLLKKKMIDESLKELFTGYNSILGQQLISDYMKDENKVNYTTYNDLINHINEWKLSQRKKKVTNNEKKENISVDRFVTKVGVPDFTLNSKENTNQKFDCIRVDVYIAHEWPEKNKYIKENISKIRRMALNKIAGSAKFKKSNLPIENIKFSSARVLKQDIIEMVFNNPA